MNIVGIGHVCIDKNIAEKARFVGAGGPGVFIHNVLTRLPGCTFSMCAPYGADFLQYQENFSLYPSKPLGLPTLVYENTVISGVRTQKCYHHETAIPVTLTGEMKNIIKNANVVCVAPLTPAYSPQYIREIKNSMNTTTPSVLLPQGYFRKFASDHVVLARDFIEAEDILPLFDVVIVSDEDYPHMERLAQKWAHEYGCLVVVTQAQHGATVFNGSRHTSVPTIPIPRNQIVSSIGAGDMFSAGFMYEYYTSRNAVASADYGNSIARQGLISLSSNLDLSKL